MLKGWAVRKVASALSDYIEGISPEAVKTSLGTDIGTLNLKGARVSAQAVEKLGLELLSSELSIDARVPWRHLSTQSTELLISKLRLEVKLLPKGSRSHDAHRTKEEEVRRLEDEFMVAAKDDKSMSEPSTGIIGGRVARASHAILRQLGVKLDGLKAVVHHELSDKAPVTISLGESVLKSVGSDWHALPAEGEEDLRKVLRLSGFELGLGSGCASSDDYVEPLIGPLAMQARLLHSPERALARLWLDLPEEAEAALRISPASVQQLRSWLDWCMHAAAGGPASGHELSDAAGQAYSSHYLKKLKSEPYDAELLARMDASASASWLATWRCQCHLQLSVKPASEPAAKKQVDYARAEKTYAQSFFSWATGARNCEKRPGVSSMDQAVGMPKVAWAEMETGDDSNPLAVEALLDEVGQQGLLPELDRPTRFRIDMLIHRFSARCSGSCHRLEGTAGGASFSIDVSAAAQAPDANGVLPPVALLRNFDVRLSLASLMLKLDDEPLLNLVDRTGGDQVLKSDTSVSEENDLDSHQALQPGAAGLQWRIKAQQRQLTMAETAAAPWDVSIFLLGEPLHVQLAPWSLHGALEAGIEVVRSWGTGVADCAQVAGNSGLLPGQTVGTDEVCLEDSSSKKELGEAAAAAASMTGFSHDGSRLCLDVEVQGPIVRLEAFRGHSVLELHLGRFCGRSCPGGVVAPQSQQGPSVLEPLLQQAAEAVRPSAFAIVCELSQTRVLIIEASREQRWVYEPSTVLVYAAVAPSEASDGVESLVAAGETLSVQTYVEAGSVRCHVDPGLLNLVGQLRVGLDHALAPLSFTGTDDNLLSPSERDRLAASIPSGLSQQAAGAFRLDFRAESFEVVWDPSGGRGFHVDSINGKVASACAKLQKFPTGEFAFEGNAEDFHLSCSSQELLRCIGRADARANWSSESVRLCLVTPPVELRWVAAAVKPAIAAVSNAKTSLETGEITATRLLLDERSSTATRASKILWSRFVQRRSQGFRDTAWGQAFADLSTFASQSDTVADDMQMQHGVVLKQVEVQLCCPEVRAVLVAHDVKKSVCAMMLGLEAKLCWAGRSGLGLNAQLRSLELCLGPRLLLAPRRDDLPLLELRLDELDSSGSFKLGVTWAQIAMVFRQRDADELAELLKGEVANVVTLGSQRDKSEVVSGDDSVEKQDTPNSANSGRSRQPLQYCFEVDAPLVFLPAGSGSAACPDGAVGGLAWIEERSQSRRRSIQPFPDEGFVVLDLGHCSVAANTSGPEDKATELLLRDMRVLSASPGEPYIHEDSWNEIISSVSARVKVSLEAECLDIQADVPLFPDQSLSTSPSVSLTRAQATQLFDVMFLNFSYESVDEVLPSGSCTKTTGAELPVQFGAAQEFSLPAFVRGMRFRLRWTGPLMLNGGFTQDAPLAQMELEGGYFEFFRSASAAGSGGNKLLQFSCQSGCIRDARKGRKGLLLELLPQAPGTSEPGFRVKAELASAMEGPEAPSHYDVVLLQPNLWMLPQLWTDLLTWGLSVYQQTAQCKVQQLGDACSSSTAQTSSECKPQVMVAHIRDGAVRFPIKWAFPEQHFALSGDTCVRFVSRTTGTHFDEFSLSNCRLLRVFAPLDAAGSRVLLSSAEGRLLCPHFKLTTSFTSDRHQSPSGDRITTYTVDLLKLERLQLSLTMLDQLELAEAVAALTGMEADSAEPQEELRLRDPSALVTRQRFAVACSIEIDGVDMNTLEVKSKQSVQPVLKLAWGCPLIQLSASWVRGEAPTGFLHLEKFWWHLSSLQECFAVWEPVFAKSEWNLDCVARPSDSHPAEAVIEVHASPCGTAPLQCVVAVSFVHLFARLCQGMQDAIASQADTTTRKRASSETTAVEEHIVGLNLTGLPCLASGTARQSSCPVLLTNMPAGLDSLLGQLGRDASDFRQTTGRLHLEFPTLPSQPTLSVEVKAGTAHPWTTTAGSLLVRVLVPRPPQVVVLVSSTVMLCNTTLIDLELRLLRNPPRIRQGSTGHGSDEEGFGIGEASLPPHCVHASVLDPTLHPEGNSSSRCRSAGAEFAESSQDTLKLPAGCFLALPPQAVSHASAEIQLRPAAAVMGEYSWGVVVRTEALGLEGKNFYTSSEPVQRGLDVHGFRLSATVGHLGTGCQVDVQPPFTLCNACPVELWCDLRWMEGLSDAWSPTKVGSEQSNSCAADCTLFVMDGHGGTWEVPLHGHTLVAPLRLNKDRCFLFRRNDEEKSSHSCHATANGLLVRRDHQRVFWQPCTSTRGGGKNALPLRIAPGQALPIFHFPSLPQASGRLLQELPALLMSIALSRHRGLLWSDAIPAMVSAGTVAEAPIDLGTCMLRCERQVDEGRAVVYARCWFNNASSEPVALMRGAREGSRELPQFGEMFIADFQDDGTRRSLEEEDVAELGLRMPGSTSILPLPSVGLGRSAKLSLSKTYSCVVMAEMLGLSSTFGARSMLVTLVPGLLAFNQLEDCELWLRQEGADSRKGVRLPPKGGSAPIRWSEPSKPKRLQAALCAPSSVAIGEEAWSRPFELSEQCVGAYPLILMDASSKRRVLCLRVNQCAGQLLTVTATGEDDCHQLINRHPCLVVDACFQEVWGKIDSQGHFVVPFGQQVAVGRPGHYGTGCLTAGGKLMLLLGDVQSNKNCAQIAVSLDRPTTINLEPSHELPFAAMVRVELRQRVARVTVSPVGLLLGSAGSAANTAGGANSAASSSMRWALEVDVRIPALDIAFVGEQRARSEVFRCHLAGLALRCQQSSDGWRQTVCDLASIQVDHHASSSMGRRGSRKSWTSSVPVLSSIGPQRALRLQVRREHLEDSCDVVIRSVDLQFFPGDEGVAFEISASQALLAEAQRLAKEATPPQLEGPSLQDVVLRAGMPYHLSLSGPPAPARKYVFHKIDINEIKIAAWCSLNIGSLPEVVAAMLTISSLSPTLEVDGARVKLPRQGFFQTGQPFEGSLDALATVLAGRYKPCLSQSWRSVLNNSNAVLGGLLTRYAWAPRKRIVDMAHGPMLQVKSGIVGFKEVSPSAAKVFKVSGRYMDNWETVFDVKQQGSTIEFVYQGARKTGVLHRQKLQISGWASGTVSDNGNVQFDDGGRWIQAVDRAVYRSISRASSMKDVTMRVNKLIAKNGVEDITRRQELNSVFGDPAPGQPKKLVVYRGGNQIELLEHHNGGPANKVYCLSKLFQAEKVAIAEVPQRRQFAIAGASSTSSLSTPGAHGAQGSTASLDADGFAQVRSTGNPAELSLFLRRLVDLLGGDVSGEAGLEAFTSECLTSGNLRSLDAVVERITSAECSWIRSASVRM